MQANSIIFELIRPVYKSTHLLYFPIFSATFCEGLPNDDYVWPWNCHKFIKCFAGITYVFNCQRSDLIFNPYKDQCVYTGEYPCIIVKSTVESAHGKLIMDEIS